MPDRDTVARSYKRSDDRPHVCSDIACRGHANPNHAISNPCWRVPWPNHPSARKPNVLLRSDGAAGDVPEQHARTRHRDANTGREANPDPHANAGNEVTNSERDTDPAVPTASQPEPDPDPVPVSRQYEDDDWSWSKNE